MPATRPRPSGRFRVSSSNGVYEQMRALVVSGRIAPGTRLVETEFARRMRVSRTPVREAIRRLAHEGLAQVVGRGAKMQIAVAPATVKDLIDLFAVIGALEGLAGRGVVNLPPADRHALASELSALNSQFARLARARRRDFARFFAAHDAFHAHLVANCATPRLRRLIEAVRPQVKRYELLYATAVGHDFGQSLLEHRDIISAVRSGAADNVELTVRLNWSKSAERLTRGLRATALGSLGDFRAEE